MDKEKERLKKIREAQIKARDPGSSKICNYDWGKHAQLAERKQKMTLRTLFLDLPGRWQGAMAGFFFGTGLAIFMNILFLTDTTRLLVFIPMIISMIIGFVVGKSTEDDPMQM